MHDDDDDEDNPVQKLPKLSQQSTPGIIKQQRRKR